MFHFALNPASYSKGHVIPPIIHWFIEGWNGFVFNPGSDQIIKPSNVLNETRREVMWDQAEVIAAAIDDTLESLGGINAALEHFIRFEFIVFVESAS